MPGSPNSASSAVAAPRELLSGIDSLDLTCKVPAPAELFAELINLKAEAGGDPRQAVTVQAGDVVLRVAATGMGSWWPVRLEHRCGSLGVGSAANRPAWRISLSAEALHLDGPAAVIAFWRSVLETLTGGPVMLLASRLDVHADFARLDITEADRAGFVCQSGRQSVEANHGALQTLYWGKRGAVTVRVYDKLAEVQASGKGGYLLGIYGEAGLQAGESVQRVEAQLRRDPLRQLGVVSAEDAVQRASAVYQYVVGKWLRLTVPDSATRRERRQLDPRWSVVQAAKVAQGAAAAARVIPDRHAPALDTIVPMSAGLAVSAGHGAAGR